MSALPVVRIIAVVCTGLFAGILLGDRAGATYARPELGPSSFVQFQQIQHVHFARMMPPLVIAAILGGLVWLLLIRAYWNSAEFWLIGLATAALIVCLVLTLRVNAPLNKELMTWTIANPPANVIDLWRPWERVHTVRTVLSVAAFLFEATALSLSAMIAARI